jgi:hypothetical protein
MVHLADLLSARRRSGDRFATAIAASARSRRALAASNLPLALTSKPKDREGDGQP